ncbi:MAG: ABC transporter ATP-binding protein [Omnitrophica bacterium]|nr:ABC transporter ATP-binding protein [Candidatus Omnitrophota bacterium]
MIRAVDLNKTYYQGRTAIRAVKSASFSISRRETVLITGPSGSGKSTLLHILGGLDKPTAGKVFFDGNDIYSLSDGARSRIRNEKIGFIFQFYHLLPEFTVLENVMLPALMGRGDKKEGVADIRRRAQNILKLVKLNGRACHRPAELSGGESQRVAIARSLINSPDILLCDEPTGNLDSTMRQEIMNCLWALKEKENMALVLVTHDERIHDGFQRVFRIEDGTIEEISGEKYVPQGLFKRQVCR